MLKPWTPPKRATGLPGKTLESVAACAALDLTYWSDHPQTKLVWAVCADNRFHEVMIDRKTGVASHYCGKSRRLGAKGELIDTVPCAEGGRRVSWAKPATMTDLFAMLGSDDVPDPSPWPADTELTSPDVDDVLEDDDRTFGEPLAADLAASEEKGPLGYCIAGRHANCTHSKGGEHYRKGLKLQDGTRYHCPCSCHRDGFTLPHYTAAEKREIKARNARLEQKRLAEQEAMDAKFLAEARARIAAEDAAAPPVKKTVVKPIPTGSNMAANMIKASPALIASIHTDLLKEALGLTDYDEQITAELQNRGITAITEAS